MTKPIDMFQRIAPTTVAPDAMRGEFTEVGIVKVPALLTRAQTARIFGKSTTWLDHYLTGEGKDLLRYARQINRRRMFITEGVLRWIAEKK